ncbi:TonB-dependent receptor [Membranihabitans marinus]|uniref:TonB-dependent receptor n=1 Tax=Membranihabitans marinus TaxID=1227546 RepID=UPI001F2CC547|nr:TonB-dependent receptor [Membranihabitans marinus]
MNIQKILILLLCIFTSSMAFAQDGYELFGRLYNAENEEPIEAATIIFEDFGTLSDSDGNFLITCSSKGLHHIKISHVSFVDTSISIVFDEGMKSLNIALRPYSQVIAEVQVTGKTNARLDRESTSISELVSEEFLAQNRENTLMQTLKKLPGVSSINIGAGQSKPVIRGLGFNRVAVVQNGIKHEAQEWGNDHGLEIDQFGIENIQIIKGPASLLYGSDAIAGVVDILPPEIPQPKTTNGEINLVGDTNNDLLGISAGIQSRKDKWYYRGRLTYRDYGDYKVPTDRISYENYIFDLHDNNLRNTAGREANANFSIGYVNNNIKSETFVSNVNGKNGFFANAHGLEVRTSSIDYDASNRDIDLPFHSVNHFKLSNTTTIVSGRHLFSFDLGYQLNHREEHSEPTAHGYMPKPSNTQERIYDKSSISLNASDAFVYNSRHRITTGVNLDYQNNSIGGWGFLIPAYQSFGLGLFAFDEFEIQEDLHFLAGIRYDYGVMDSKSYYDWYPSPEYDEEGNQIDVYQQRASDGSLHFGNISASTGLSYIRNNNNFKINIGKSFRMPLAKELVSNGLNYHMFRFEMGNQDLDAEESYQIDVEVEHRRGNFTVSLSPFVNYFTNYIYLNPTSRYNENLQIYEYTQAEVFRWGGEISAELNLSSKWQIQGSGEYVFSRQQSGPKKGFTLPFSPPVSALFSTVYHLKDFAIFKNSKLITDFRITGAQENIVPPEEITEGYSVWHFSWVADWAIIKDAQPWEIRLKVNNLFDVQYFDHSSFYRLIDVPEPGRNISLSLTFPF